ncbi:unnamed protein product, partial [Candidula unifasciata]
ADGRTFSLFFSHKCERSHMMKRKPRNINWSVLNRREDKKGHCQGHYWCHPNDILDKGNHKPEVRKARLEQATR